jgi:hypothetical protein
LITGHDRDPYPRPRLHRRVSHGPHDVTRVGAPHDSARGFNRSHVQAMNVRTEQ